MYLGKVIGRVVATVKDSALEAKPQFRQARRLRALLRLAEAEDKPALEDVNAFLGNGRPWDADDWTVGNRSMVNEAGGTLPGLALRRVLGKPHCVTEYNHSAPNTFGSEGFFADAAPPMGDKDLSARAGELDGDRLAQAPSRTGHDRGPTAEIDGDHGSRSPVT